MLLEKPDTNMPTTRQIIAVKTLAKVLRNSKNQKGITIQKILKEAGYSDYMAISSTQVTRSKGFQSLLDKYLPEDKVYRVHSELIESKKMDSYKLDAKLTDKEIEQMVEDIKGCKVRRIVRDKNDPFVTVYFYTPDGIIRKSAVDMAYKLRGSYAAEKVDLSGGIEMIEVNNYGSTKKSN